jgi:hypothetical protein
LIAAILPSVASDGAIADLVVIDIGSSGTFTSTFDGQLLFRLNESPADWRDNAGTIKVHVRYSEAANTAKFKAANVRPGRLIG